MDSVLSWFKKALVPLLGLSLALALLPQVKAGRGRVGGTGSSAAHLASATSALPAADSGRVTAEGRLVTYPGAQVEVAIGKR